MIDNGGLRRCNPIIQGGDFMLLRKKILQFEEMEDFLTRGYL